MKTIAILLLTCSILSGQNLSKKDKKIITGIGLSTTLYGFAKPGLKKVDPAICVSGILFAAIPYIFDQKGNIQVNGNGICIKISERKYKRKHAKKVCKN